VEIVVKVIAVLAHTQVQLLFASVPKWWMPDVMYQSKRFGKGGVQSQGTGDGTCNLRHFDCVGQAISKVVGIARGENLRLGFQAAKRA
jgi:hypothetical protein